MPAMWNFEGMDLECEILWCGVMSAEDADGMVRSDCRGVNW